MSPSDIQATEVAGQPIQKILTTAPGDGNPIGGIKVIAKDGWVAARPSGTEEIYKIYAESFLGENHLGQIEEEAKSIVSETLARGCYRSTNHLENIGQEISRWTKNSPEI